MTLLNADLLIDIHGQTQFGAFPQTLNISIPATQTSPYTISDFPQPAGLNFVAAMYDEGAGGYGDTLVTDVLSR